MRIMPKKPSAPARKPATEKPEHQLVEPIKVKVPEIDKSGKDEILPAIKRDNIGRVSTKDAADLIGVSDRTLRNWKADGCPAIFDGGAVDIKGVIAWRENKLITEAAQDKADIIEATGGLTLQQVQVRHEIAKARMTELKLAVQIGLLLPRDVYIHALSTLMADVNSRLHAMPRKIAPLVANESQRGACEEIVKEKVDDMLAILMVDVAMNLQRNHVDPFEQADKDAAEESSTDADG